MVGLTFSGHGGDCTSIHSFTAFHNWDYGVLPVGGVKAKEVRLHDFVIADNRHVGMLIQVRGPFVNENAQVIVDSATFVGATSAAACQMCAKADDPDCHTMLST